MALKSLKKDLITATIAVLAFTLLCGILYPLVITGVSQVALCERLERRLVLGLLRFSRRFLAVVRQRVGTRAAEVGEHGACRCELGWVA